MKYIVCYLIIINIVTLLLYGMDKYKATHHKWRIPESTLLLAAAFGGSPSAWIGMYLFHHKTRKAKFKAGVPALLFLQIIFFLVYFYCMNK